MNSLKTLWDGRVVWEQKQTIYRRSRLIFGRGWIVVCVLVIHSFDVLQVLNVLCRIGYIVDVCWLREYRNIDGWMMDKEM